MGVGDRTIGRQESPMDLTATESNQRCKFEKARMK